jgi:ABC-type Fe3+-siderophore transport system permease subunit
MRSLKDFRLSLPAILGLVAGAGLTVSFVIIALILRGSPLGVLLVAGIGMIGTAIGLYVGSQFTKHVIGTNWRITAQHDDQDDRE